MHENEDGAVREAGCEDWSEDANKQYADSRCVDKKNRRASFELMPCGDDGEWSGREAEGWKRRQA
jgi:hypothetical protein